MARPTPVPLALAGLAVAGCTKQDDVPQGTSVSAPAQSAPSDSHAGKFLIGTEWRSILPGSEVVR